MAAGSVQSYAFDLIIAYPGSSVPWPITGATWQYVARQQDDAGTGTALITVTQDVSAAGIVTVTDTDVLSRITVTLYPAATTSLTPGAYAHALWSNPGDDTAGTWWAGALIITPNPQP